MKTDVGNARNPVLAPSHSFKIATEELATILRLRPQSIRAALCRNGHVMGLRPVKLPNGRLLWSADEARKLVGEVA